MGVEPPFIYDRPSAYTFASPTSRPYNPKAATQASWTNYSVPKPKPNGPLIDFNRHPDSYLIVPYGNLNVKPMHPKTRDRVLYGRAVQLFLRSCALLGALGLLFCVIAINKTTLSVAWIIRAAPAVALCHCVYGIYHLCRSATGRTPASTASYMVFAGMVDTGLVPFFCFAALLSHSDYTENTYKWSTLFDDSVISYKIIYAFFLLCCTEGGILVLSLFLDVYLATMFRKIAKMPPDMNPLEPNLTARPNTHKRNKSEMTITEKHMSGSTLASKNTAGRRIPFIHTRTDSAETVTLFGNESARNSRVEMRKEMRENESDPYAHFNNGSRVTLAPTRPSSAVSPEPNSRSPGTGLDHRPARSSALAQPSSKASSWLSYMDYEGQPTQLSESAKMQLEREIRDMPLVSPISSRDSSLDRTQSERDNWYHSPVSEIAPLSIHNKSTSALDRSPATPVEHPQSRRSREPLGMNPPTPQAVQFQDENFTPYQQQYGSQPDQYDNRSPLRDTDGNARGRDSFGSKPASFIGSGGKTRFYGNLRDSIGSRGPVGSEEATTNEIEVIEVDDYDRTTTMQSTSDYSGNFEVYDGGSDDEIDNQDRDQAIIYSQRNEWNGQRQVSNSTGYDLSKGYAGLGAEFGAGMGRRREVSGKVAEEGRGDIYRNDAAVHTEAVVNEQPARFAAAGWARFKGL